MRLAVDNHFMLKLLKPGNIELVLICEAIASRCTKL